MAFVVLIKLFVLSCESCNSAKESMGVSVIVLSKRGSNGVASASSGIGITSPVSMVLFSQVRGTWLDYDSDRGTFYTIDALF